MFASPAFRTAVPGSLLLLLLPACPSTPFMGHNRAIQVTLEEPGDAKSIEIDLTIQSDVLEYIQELDTMYNLL